MSKAEIMHKELYVEVVEEKKVLYFVQSYPRYFAKLLGISKNLSVQTMFIQQRPCVFKERQTCTVPMYCFIFTR